MTLEVTQAPRKKLNKKAACFPIQSFRNTHFQRALGLLGIRHYDTSVRLPVSMSKSPSWFELCNEAYLCYRDTSSTPFFCYQIYMKSYRDYLGFSDCHLNQRGTSVFILLNRKAVFSEFSVKLLGLPSEKAYIQALLYCIDLKPENTRVFYIKNVTIYDKQFWFYLSS